MANPLIVALDFPELTPCRKLLKELEGIVSIYKVGSELFTACGWEAVDWVQRSGAKVFLDLKLHDIPTTVARTARVIAKKNVFMFNVHAFGGFEMMCEARKAVDEVSSNSAKPLLVAVTVLTSLEEGVLSKELGVSRPLRDEVLELARLAQRAGLDGVVVSPREIDLLTKEFGPKFVLVTPGIRPLGSAPDDQARSLAPREAIERGAHYLVVGRPITASPDPRRSARDLLQSLA